MSDPEAWRAFGRKLASPPAVMIFTAIAGVGTTADYRVDVGAMASVRYHSDFPDTIKAAAAAVPEAHRAVARAATVIGVLARRSGAADAEEPLVLAALRPSASLVDLPPRYRPVAPSAGIHRPTKAREHRRPSDALVGPPEPVALTMSRYETAAAVGFCEDPTATARTASTDDAAPRPDPRVVVAARDADDVAEVAKEESGSGPVSAEVSIARAEPVGPYIPKALRLARLSAAANKRRVAAAKAPQRAVVLARPLRPSQAGDSHDLHDLQDLHDLMGPPLPADYRLRQRRGPAEATVLAMLADYDEDEFVGPRLPADEAPQVHEHELPFDPLTERAFTVATARARRAPSELERFMAGDDGVHTVRYIRDVKHRIRSGETFSEVLGTAGLSPREVDSWIVATRAYYNVDRVYAGQQMELVLDMPERQLKRMKLEVGRDAIVIVEETAAGVVARREDIQYERRLRVVGGVIDRSLYVTAIEKGIPDRVISDIAEILGWEVNFGRDLRPGDMFRVIYEELTRVDTLESRAGRVLAVEVVNRGKSHEAFYYQTANGVDAGYYDRDGKGLGRAFLRYPVAFSRISSHFSSARYHPVLKRRVPHYGVDFAASTGTPVKAVADGTISQAGWFNGNGRFVKMRHDSIYESGYAHLSRIPSRIKAGVEVKKGDIIGYVGSTGLATGPHLHFAMYRRGKYIDPLKADLPRARSLQGRELAGFRMKIDMMDRAYAEGGEGAERSTQVAALPAEQRSEATE